MSEQACINPDLVEKAKTNYTILKYFKYDHLPEHLQQHSKPFSDLAMHVACFSPHNAETSVALRKLLEAKDAAVRATI